MPAPGPVAENERREERRSQILTASLFLFAEKGIDGTGLRDIARAVGITQPTLYHYFTSKDELVSALIEECAHHTAEQQQLLLRWLEEAPTLRAGLSRLAEGFLSAFNIPEMRAFHQLTMTQMAQGGPVADLIVQRVLVPRRRTAAGLFRQLIAAGKIRDVDPELLTLQFIGPLFFTGMLMTAGHDPSLTPERMREFVFQHLETFIRGIERN